MESSERPHEDEDRVPVAWVFLPLPQPLGLPENLAFQEDRSLEEHIRFNARSSIRYSAMILQVARSSNVLTSDTLDIAQAISRRIHPTATAEDWTAMPALGAQADGDHSRITLLEVTVPLEGELGEDDIDGAIALAVEAARRVQASVSLVLNRPLRLTSRTLLPPTIFILRGDAHASGSEPRFEELVVHPIDESAPPSTFGLKPEPVSEEQLAVLPRAADQLGRGSFLAGYVDLRREAMVQRRLDGNTRLAVITSAIAAEVLLDSLLLHMLWEEHTQPADAAAVFDRRVRHQTRIASHFPPRLGGDWDPNGSGPIRRYFYDLVYLRNRVVHTGATPTETEATEALDAFGVLEKFCGDRLARAPTLRRYTRTAMGFMGESGLRRRNAWTKHVRRLVRSDAEPNWLDAFKRYRHLVDRHTREWLSDPGADPSALELYYETSSDIYILRDAEALCATVVTDVECMLTPEQHEGVDKLRRSLAAEGVRDTVRSRLELDPSQLVPTGDEVWRPEAELFPELTMWPATKTEPPSI